VKRKDLREGKKCTRIKVNQIKSNLTQSPSKRNEKRVHERERKCWEMGWLTEGGGSVPAGRVKGESEESE
jgi:hypothetical protein